MLKILILLLASVELLFPAAGYMRDILYKPCQIEMFSEVESLNMRDLPSKAGNVVGSLALCEPCDVVGSWFNNSWYELSNGAFVKADYMTKASGVSLCQADGIERYIDWFNQLLSILPDSLLKEIEANGWVLGVTDKDIDDYYFGGRYGRVKGVTISKDKQIFFEDRDSARTAILHEVGHYFDFQHGVISNTDGYLAIYNEEEARFHDAYNLNIHWDIREFWAEAFSEYFLDRDRLRSVCPKISDLLDFYLSDYQ